MSFNSLLYINVCFMAMILHVLFLKLLKLLTCYLVFVNVYVQIKAFGFLNYLRYSYFSVDGTKLALYKVCCIIHTSFCVFQVFFVYVVIIEVNHLLTKSTMLASEPTSFLSLMIFVLSSLNDFYAFVLFQ